MPLDEKEFAVLSGANAAPLDTQSHSENSKEAATVLSIVLPTSKGIEAFQNF